MPLWLSDEMINEANLEALEAATGLAVTPTSIVRLARQTSPEAARWAFTQWELRKRARAKFAKADEMLFTREALEQATDERLARFHAIQFPMGAKVADLTVGIGADLIAIAAEHEAVGYEIDPERAEYARWNLKQHGLEAEVRERDCLEVDWDFEYAFADPSRRASGKRTLDPEQFSPNLKALAEKMSHLELGIIKLSPMLPDRFLETIGRRQEFLSLDRECREVLVFVGKDQAHGDGAMDNSVWVRHCGTGLLLGNFGHAHRTVDSPGAFLFDADPGAVRAGCLGELCHQHSLSQLGDSNGYLTGDRVESEWLQGFEVLDHGRYDLAELRRKLIELESATPVLKQRHVGLDLQKLSKQLTSEGNRQLTVAFYPVGKSIRFAILNPLRALGGPSSPS